MIIETCPCAVEIHHHPKSSPISFLLVCHWWIEPCCVSWKDRSLLPLPFLPSSFSFPLSVSLSLYGRTKKTFQGKSEFIKMALVCCLLQPGLHQKKNLLSFFLYVFLSIRTVLRLVLSMVEQAADSLVTSVEDKQWREEEGLMRGTATAGVCHRTST